MRLYVCPSVRYRRVSPTASKAPELPHPTVLATFFSYLGSSSLSSVTTCLRPDIEALIRAFIELLASWTKARRSPPISVTIQNATLHPPVAQVIMRTKAAFMRRLFVLCPPFPVSPKGARLLDRGLVRYDLLIGRHLSGDAGGTVGARRAMFSACLARPCHSTLENIFWLMNSGSASTSSTVAVFTSIIRVPLTGPEHHALGKRRGARDVGVDVAVLLVVDDVEEALLPEQALEVEVVRLLVEQRRALSCPRRTGGAWTWCAWRSRTRGRPTTGGAHRPP